MTASAFIDRTVAFRVSPRLWEELSRKAEQEEQTVSGWLREIVRDNVRLPLAQEQKRTA